MIGIAKPGDDEKRRMAPDTAFYLALAIKMAVTALFVIAATITAERAGAVIGALIATLPISTGPAYIFLSLDHPPEFIAQSALTSLVGNVVTGFYALVFVLLAQRGRPRIAVPIAFAAWLSAAFVLTRIEWTPLSAALVNAVAFPVFYLLTTPFRDVPMPRLALRVSDLVIRALLVALLVASVVTLSFHIGPGGSGLLAIVPIVYTSIMVILQRRVGIRAAGAVIANGFVGLAGFGAAMLTLQVCAVPLGSPAALTLALAVSIGWNASAYLMRRRSVPA